MKTWVLCALFGCAAMAQGAFTGKDFVEACGSGERGAFCEGLVFGYLQWIDERNICYRLPDAYGSGTLHNEIVAYVRAQPERESQKVSMLVTEMLLKRYSCCAR